MVFSRNIAALVLCGALAAPALAAAQVAVPRGNGDRVPPGQVRQYQRGYDEGRVRGEQDARRGRPYFAETRGNGRVEFRRGFADGYRAGYDGVRRSSAYGPFGRNDRRDTVRGNPGTARRLPGGYQEPAFARGYADGYEEGLQAFRDRDRYDPVGSRDYRNGDQGYYGSYGSREAYRNNYRGGFRQGYEEGYRSGR
jgi:hypothetical protein